MLLLGLSTTATAQDITLLSAPSPRWNLLASTPLGNFDTLRLPIKRVGNLILIEAEIDSQRGNFIFDTGAPGLILNTHYYKDVAVERLRASTGVVGTSAKVLETRVKLLKLQEMYYENMIVELTDLTHIENNKGIKILGLLGTALFESLEFTIDIRENNIQFYRINKSINVSSDDAIRLPISYTNNAIFLNTKLKNKNLSLCFDTGAEMTVLDNYLPKSIMNLVKINKRINLSGVNAQRLEVFAGTIDEFNVANVNWLNLPVIITGLQDLADIYQRPLDGIIGYDLLDRGVLKVNISKREMRLYLYTK